MKDKFYTSQINACDQEYDKMPMVGGKRYCELCNQHLTDFRNSTKAEILETILKSTEKVCGVYDADLFIDKPRRSLFRNQWLPRSMGWVSIFTMGVVGAQEHNSQPMDSVMVVENDSISRANNNITTEKEYTIKGTVTDDDGFPITGINVSIKELNLQTLTGFDGNYIVTFKTIASQITLIIEDSFHIYIPIEENILLNSSHIIKSVVIEPEMNTYEDIIILGGIKRANIFQRTWWEIKGWFRKKDH